MGDKDQRQNEKMQVDQTTPACDQQDAEGLPQELKGAIGKQLKRVYGQMLAEPMPDKFSLLLETLSKSENGSKK